METVLVGIDEGDSKIGASLVSHTSTSESEANAGAHDLVHVRMAFEPLDAVGIWSAGRKSRNHVTDRMCDHAFARATAVVFGPVADNKDPRRFGFLDPVTSFLEFSLDVAVIGRTAIEHDKVCCQQLLFGRHWVGARCW